jgi:hypothetical protein
MQFELVTMTVPINNKKITNKIKYRELILYMINGIKINVDNNASHAAFESLL